MPVLLLRLLATLLIAAVAWTQEPPVRRTARVGRVAENDAGLLERDPLAVPPPELDDPPPAPR